VVRHAGRTASEWDLNWELLLVVFVVAFIVIVIAARIKGDRDYKNFLKKAEQEKQQRKE